MALMGTIISGSVEIFILLENCPEVEEKINTLDFFPTMNAYPFKRPSAFNEAV